jgi:DNA helicase-2/ATP-dependent DNA helicase PcrA
MYVGLTRAERYLYVSCSGPQRSKFFRELGPVMQGAGGHTGSASGIPRAIRLQASAARRDDRLATSFSDLRYFLECPHDFYLRKVLGFAPAIDQAFGYGRGVHNILRAIHENPKKWARLAEDSERLEKELGKLVYSPMFYMRYTTGEPLDNLRRKAMIGLKQYVAQYVTELGSMDFEPEREFETMLDEDKLLVTGAIDLVRHTDPPRVSIIDFKSGEQDSANQSGLSKELMKLQIGVYGLAAKKELEYEPDQGLIRYIGEEDPTKRQVEVTISDAQLEEHRKTVVEAGRRIRGRDFHHGPTPLVAERCKQCDFGTFCGKPTPKDKKAPK